MNNEIIFTGLLKEITVTPYASRVDNQEHSRVNLKLESEERFPQDILLKCTGSIGDQLAALQLQPGLATITAYLEFHTHFYGEPAREYQEISAWKLLVNNHTTGVSFEVKRSN